MKCHQVRLAVIAIFAMSMFGTGPALFSAEKAAKKGFNKVKIEKLLVDSQGKPYQNAKLGDKKYILIYFSAHWCPPCRAFTPKLVEYYNKKSKSGDFELLFVSFDKSEKAMRNYMQETSMPWPAVKFDMIDESGLKAYAGNGIPCLVLIDGSGNIISDSFRGGEYLGPNKVLDDLDKILEKKM